MDPRKVSAGENRVVPVETTIPVPVDPKYPNKVLNVGSQLNASIQNILIFFLKQIWMFLLGLMPICAEYPQKLRYML